MAVFSAPYQTPDDAQHAVIAAVKQQEHAGRDGARSGAQQGKRSLHGRHGAEHRRRRHGQPRRELAHELHGHRRQRQRRRAPLQRRQRRARSSSASPPTKRSRTSSRSRTGRRFPSKAKSNRFASTTSRASRRAAAGAHANSAARVHRARPRTLRRPAFAASVFGSMVGLGGGFILVPVLRLFFGFEPAEAAGTSLVLVVANSASGSVAYLLQRRVHVRVGLLIALGGLPGSILGAWAVTRISAQTFDWLLAALLIAVGTDLILNRHRRIAGRADVSAISATKGMSYRLAISSRLHRRADFESVRHRRRRDRRTVAACISRTCRLTPSARRRTSPSCSPRRSAWPCISRSTTSGLATVVPLVAGGLLGGPIGARLSLRLKSSLLLLLVAVALFAAAGSLILKHLIR